MGYILGSDLMKVVKQKVVLLSSKVLPALDFFLLLLSSLFNNFNFIFNFSWSISENFRADIIMLI